MADASDSAGGRVKRQKLDKFGRAAAFDKLRKLKGSKHKFEDSELDNVYEEVDEREYSKRVLERQDDDWIEDDDGSGYVEDGREIFDDDMDDEAIYSASKKTPKGKMSRTNQKSGKESVVSNVKSNSIKNMLMNLPSKKKKESAVRIDEDKLLGDIMQELNSTPVVVKPSLLRPHAKQISSPYQRSNYSRKSDSIPYSPRNVSSETVCSGSTILDTPASEAPVSSNTGIKRKLEESETSSFPSDSQFIEETDSQPQLTEDIIEDLGDSMDEEDIVQISEEVEKEHFQTNKVKEPSPIKVNNDKAIMKEICESEMQTSTPPSLKLEEGTLPLERSYDGKVEGVLRFFWLDALEGPPGTVYIFGKVKCGENFVSCCVTAKNIQRQIYLLPREEEVNLKTGNSMGKQISIMDVYNEFNDEVATQHRIFEFKSRKVVRKYAFDLPDVPLSSEYLEVRYPAGHGALSRNFSGRTFSRVFGTETSFLELLLLERRIKGPCWIEVHGAEAAKSRLSWCTVEAVAENVDAIVPVSREATDGACAPPPLTILSLALRTALNHRTGQTEVVLAGGVVKKDFRCDTTSGSDAKKQRDDSFCILARPDRVSWPIDCDAHLRSPGRRPVVRVDSERALLSVFLGKIQSLDPDVIVGHGISDFELEVITHRLTALGVSQPSRIGRLRRGNDPRNAKGSYKATHKERFPLSGRLMCDTKISAKELIKSRSYELRPLCRKVLDGFEEDSMEEQGSVEKDDVAVAFSNGASLASLVTKVTLESHQVLRLLEALHALPLALQITNIAGNVMSRTLAGGRSERNEFLLLHAFTERGYIVPDKTFGSRGGGKGEGKESGRREAAYAGGLVLDPKVGLYDTLILLMDFNSLYPSIIQEYNICFTTLPRNSMALSDNKEVNEQALLEMLPDPDSEPGVLPSEIRKLVESRRAVKKLMASSNLTPAQQRQYDVRQMALKLTANSMYGCLGFGGSRFQARELAALITAKGREILSRTRDLVQGKLALNVIYGDTDSVMIDTGNKGDYDAALKIGSKVKTEVNKMYRQVELDVDGVFERMLLLKKKKYAALILEKKGQQLVQRMELKGLDIVRRDWSRLSVEAGKFVVAQLLGADGLSAEIDDRLERITSYLENLKEEMESGKVPISKLVISKQLTKGPETYADGKSLPHVQVALRHNAQPGTRPFVRGDTVPYVICTDGSTNSAARRAYHLGELAKGKSVGANSVPLKVDVHYYLAQQVHPVVSRLCEPIPGMDANRVAVCLGLDPVYGQRPSQPSTRSDIFINIGPEPGWNFQGCEKFSFTCMNDKCKQVNEVDGPVRKKESSLSYVLQSCVNPECTVSPWEYLPSIQNALTFAMRKHIDKYYKGWLICEDPGCPNRIRRIPTTVRGAYPVCSGCHSGCMMREYDETQLYTQLLYYSDMFDLSKCTSDQKPPGKVSRNLDVAYTKLKDQVLRTLACSAYAVIDLGKLFYPFKKMKI